MLEITTFVPSRELSLAGMSDVEHTYTWSACVGVWVFASSVCFFRGAARLAACVLVTYTWSSIQNSHHGTLICDASDPNTADAGQEVA